MELNEELAALREKAKEGRDPACADETLDRLLSHCRERRPARILEIGCAEGLTGCALLFACGAEYVGIENDPARAERAKRNFARFGFSERVSLFEEDAAAVLPRLEGEFDLIFLDGPKVQYVKYLPHCKRLLSRGGYLFSDDVLLYGWVRGTPPDKRRALVRHLREFLAALEADEDLITEVLELGEGLAVSQKR